MKFDMLDLRRLWTRLHYRQIIEGLEAEVLRLGNQLATTRAALHDIEEQARRGAEYADKNSVSTHLELLLMTIAGCSRMGLDATEAVCAAERIKL